MDQSLRTQNRNSQRSPVMLTANLELAGAVQPVILRNLSTGGALVEGESLPTEGSILLFTRKDVRVRARVAWVEGKYAGIAFECPLERAELLRQVPRPKEKFEARFRRPGLASGPLSDADRQMLQMWATPDALRRS